MKILKTELVDVLIIEYQSKEDNRGFRLCSYNDDELRNNGIIFKMKREYRYYPTFKGTLYGIHFQNHPYPQAKMMSCIKGRGIDYSIDLRKNSPNYLRWIGIPINEQDNKEIYIPKGFGHVFLSLEDNTIVNMRIDEVFVSSASGRIKYNDQTIGINYPIDNIILSKEDFEAPGLIDAIVDFNFQNKE